MSTVHAVLAELKALFNAVASIPGDEMKLFISAAVTILTTYGLLHVANASAFVNEVTAIVLILLAAGVAIEKVLNGAAAFRNSFKK